MTTDRCKKCKGKGYLYRQFTDKVISVKCLYCESEEKNDEEVKND